MHKFCYPIKCIIQIYLFAQSYVLLSRDVNSYRSFNQVPFITFKAYQYVYQVRGQCQGFSVKISPDQTRIAIGNSQGDICLYNIKTGLLIDCLIEKYGFVDIKTTLIKIQWIQDSIILEISDGDNITLLIQEKQYDTTISCFQSISILQKSIQKLIISQLEKKVNIIMQLSACQNNKVDKTIRYKQHWLYNIESDSLITNVQFSSDGQTIYASDNNSNIQIFNSSTHQRQQKSIKVDGKVIKMQILSEGNVIGLTDRNKLFKLNSYGI